MTTRDLFFMLLGFSGGVALYRLLIACAIKKPPDTLCDLCEYGRMKKNPPR